ncbi:MAG: molybdenum cofactor guanylyltransferase [Saprospiraceae bacterium]|uniref:molybdenum cofactor guanylyltransferase n=1 Tax=Candidatus Brachybacter algidus TaxID=2982024 RepID=UPI00257C77A0|nr:molybdenum cofactor guanylyltransferase [Candidatus Brachybacter algidus]MBK7603860.1 molybdenum cofactor guanylyltransferase [Candidatus Brachybacter algidus]
MVKKNIFKGIIICGGQSSRMGSDKSLLFWNGVPFYKHIEKILSKHCDQVFISCNESQKSNYDLPVIVDNYEQIGPMAGVLTSLESFPNCPIFTFPCDMPFIDQGIIKKMIGGYNNTFDGVFIKDSKGQIEPLIAIYNPSIYSKLLAWYDSGNYSLKKFIESCNNVSYIKLGEQSLININTTKELDNLKRKN